MRSYGALAYVATRMRGGCSPREQGSFVSPSFRFRSLACSMVRAWLSHRAPFPVDIVPELWHYYEFIAIFGPILTVL